MAGFTVAHYRFTLHQCKLGFKAQASLIWLVSFHIITFSVDHPQSQQSRSLSLSHSLSLALAIYLPPSLFSSLSLCISASARRLETYVLTPRRKGVMGPNAISSPCKFIEVCPDRQRSADTERHPQLTPLFIPAHLGPVKKSSGVHWRKTGFQRNGRERERV